MRGPDDQTNHMFSYLSPEQRVRADHPLRAIRAMTDRGFAELSPRFTKMYSDIGRPSIPPEQLLRALLLQALYTIRSERLLTMQRASTALGDPAGRIRNRLRSVTRRVLSIKDEAPSPKP